MFRIRAASQRRSGSRPITLKLMLPLGRRRRCYRKTFRLSLHSTTTMPKATAQRKGSSMKHDPLAIQLRAGELDDSGVLSAPGKRQKEKRHQQEEVRKDP